MLSTVDMVVQRRDGPRWLRELDDDDDERRKSWKVYRRGTQADGRSLFGAAVCHASC